MSNRLSDSNSPYLLQHKDNPVDWYPWGEEALDRAKKENKAIFLSIGYAACHWCHVMEHESFEDPEVAQLMNDSFINIKVDREERPDIDGIYMQAVIALTGQGGWPMNLFLTPAGKPFYGGTYFPPTPRYGMPGFKELLMGVANAWKNDNQNVLNAGNQLVSQLQQTITLSTASDLQLEADNLKLATDNLVEHYDWQNGGWGQAPKFPQPMSLSYLLRQASYGNQNTLEISEHALRAMAKGGMYDVVGGGFARYSVDNAWLVPHFEKMLYDNALLSKNYLHAYLLTEDKFFKRICEETLDFVIREMTHSEGGFYSSLDADSEGIEGKFYVWKLAEIAETLTNETDLTLFIAAYGITEHGNFEGNTILQRALSDEELAEKFKLDKTLIPAQLGAMHKKLLQRRSARIRPGTDDKILVSWNGWMLKSFSEAARYLKQDDYLAVAQKNANFLLAEFHDGERLLRSWRNGKAMHNAYLEDYASLILGLLALYQSDGDPKWYQNAQSLTKEMLEHFIDESGKIYDIRNDHEALISRPQELQDNATPSGTSLAAQALLEMHSFSGNGEWYDLAISLLSQIQALATKHPTGFANWLSALDFAQGDTKEIVIVGKRGAADTQRLFDIVWGKFRPDCVLAIKYIGESSGHPPLLEQREMLDGKATAYVCKNFICKTPITDNKALEQALN